MLNIKVGNILEVKHGIVAHQVNCRGVMGAGLAYDIRMRWPIVFANYIDAFHKGLIQLGYCQLVFIHNNLYVANLCGQLNYGGKPNEVYTDYQALHTALTTLRMYAGKLNLPVFLPYKIGCGRGHGDWAVVTRLIEDACPNAVILDRCRY